MLKANDMMSGEYEGVEVSFVAENDPEYLLNLKTPVCPLVLTAALCASQKGEPLADDLSIEEWLADRLTTEEQRVFMEDYLYDINIFINWFQYENGHMTMDIADKLKKLTGTYIPQA